MESTSALRELANEAAAALAADHRPRANELKAALVSELEGPLEAFEAYLEKVDPIRHGQRWQPLDRTEVDAALDAWIDGRDDAFSDVTARSDPREVARYIKDRWRADRRRLYRPIRKRLREATDVFSGVLAETLRLQSPAGERLELARYVKGVRREFRLAHVPAQVEPPTPLPVRGRSLAAIVARRLAVLERPTTALSPFDPLGIAESVVSSDGPAFADTPGGPLVFAVRRALLLTSNQAADWTEDLSKSSPEMPAEVSLDLGIAICRALDEGGLSADDAAELLAMPPPPSPVLNGTPRAAVRLALGDRTALGEGPRDEGPWAAWLWVLAVRVAGCAEPEQAWLVGCARQADGLMREPLSGRPAVAAAALLAWRDGPHTEHVLAVARRVPEWLVLTVMRYRDGLLSLEEVDVNRREATLLSEALREHGDAAGLVALLEVALREQTV